MMEEHFMRSWTHGHERLSADLDRGIQWLKAAFRRFAELVTPIHAPGEDAYFDCAVPARRLAKRAAVPVRITKRR
ncbi:hypothetical protein L7H23_13230 [Sphingopyxis sp. BSN-002]|uniref:hypothetical protein n=1 Tax=Sphingopyxis sp. BSN-002 TaxID=2911495 RepID=UPI001EDB4401|nr:hypothetical protein [Sphingopyxis sp. BSN-002]UKK83520.1 hypothetical protein L7H23_13230 [Sphingopyxis sp. BSN-002]